MSSRDWKFRIEDIIHSIDKIEFYIGTMTLTQFKKNELVIDAVIRNFEIIGEAAKNIPQSVKKQHQALPWAEMSGMRNVLIHEYFGVDITTLWHTIKEHLPKLRSELKNIL